MSETATTSGRISPALEGAWGIIANVSGGDWSKQAPEWQKSAREWFLTHLAGDERVTALAEWTPERPDVPGFYWWGFPGAEPEIVRLSVTQGRKLWVWMGTGWTHPYTDDGHPSGSLWWPVRLEAPPVG